MKNLHTLKTVSLVFLYTFSLCIYGQTDRPEYAPDQVIVKMKDQRSSFQKKNLKSQMKGTLRERNPLNNVEVWDIDQSQKRTDIRQLVKQYRNHPDIEYIEPNYYYYLTSDVPPKEDIKAIYSSRQLENNLNISMFKTHTNSSFPFVGNTVSNIPSDVEFSHLWGMDNTGQNNGINDADIDAPEAWDITTGSPSIVVAIIDTGIDWKHPDLVDNIWQNLGEDADGDGRVLEWINNTWVLDPGDQNNIDDDLNGYIDDFVGWDFADNDNDPFDNSGYSKSGHGTHVAGTIGATGDNGIGVTGVTWDVKLAGLRAFNGGQTNTLSISKAIEYALLMDMPLSNNSYAGPASTTISNAIHLSKTKGHLFVASAGKLLVDNFPANSDFDNIISVTATNRSDELWANSNYDQITVDIAAPGHDILSTIPNGIYGYDEGTSMAAPHVTGACALLWELDTGKTYADIKAAILNSADSITALSGKCVSEGRLNVNEALSYFSDDDNTTITPPSPGYGCRTVDSLALIALYNSTNGASWDIVWDLSEPMDTWHGVTLDENSCVSVLSLPNNGLYGSIAPEIGSLTQLHTLYLGTNRLKNDIPKEIGNLIKLKVLNLDSNNLEGSIPRELGSLYKLEELMLSHNRLTGNIPSTIGYLKNLTYLWLHGNNLSGEIPSEIGNLNSLNFLLLYENELTGSIPTEIGNLNNVAELYLGGNYLTGSIPSEMGNLNKLSRLSLDENELSGCYDNNLINLRNLHSDSRISDGNYFDEPWEDFINNGIGSCDPVPDCRPSDSLALVALYDSTNGLGWTNTWDLSQAMHTWYGVSLNGFGCVASLDLSANQLIGTIPSEIGLLSNLEKLYLVNNQLSGTIPSSIGTLHKLSFLSFKNNQLTGGIPTEIGNLTELMELDLSMNKLINASLKEIIDLSKLDVLDLSMNRLIDSLPPTILNLRNLRILRLSDNDLGGTIPPVIGNLNRLTELDMSGNSLRGSIPSAVGGLGNLTELKLFNNDLNGPIPPAIGNLNNLKVLWLNENDLTGSIPRELGDLKKMNSLALRANQLSGCYDENLSSVCSQVNSIQNYYISDNNNLDATWENFCFNEEGICPTETIDLGTTVVWPGDMDNDGDVDINDPLYWGIAAFETGPVRPTATSGWTSQVSPNWQFAAVGVNNTHQDADGNGIINQADLQVVHSNFEKTNNTLLSTPITSTLNYSLKDIAPQNGNKRYELHLIKVNDEPVMAHGISCIIDFDDESIINATVDVIGSSLIPSEVFQEYNVERKQLAIALTRTDGVDKVCDGAVAIITIEKGISPESSGFRFRVNSGNTVQANGDLEGIPDLTYHDDYDGYNPLGDSLFISAFVVHEQCGRLGKLSVQAHEGTGPYTYQWSTGQVGFNSEIENLYSGIYSVTATDQYGISGTRTVQINGQVPTYDSDGILICGRECPDYLTPTGLLLTNAHAGVSLTSDGRVATGRDVQFRAGETVILDKGFSVQSNTTFLVRIEACDED